MLRGEAGIGKAVLLEHLRGRATGCHVVRAVGIEAERELAFAALHQICAPMLNRLAHLPAAQAEALRTAFGISAGSPPDPFMVGLGLLGLLADVASAVLFAPDQHVHDRPGAGRGRRRDAGLMDLRLEVRRRVRPDPLPCRRRHLAGPAAAGRRWRRGLADPAQGVGRLAGRLRAGHPPGAPRLRELRRFPGPGR
ncbi:hypothetical protein ACIA5D_35465 [Actinoplanes sp. NPDC051513]|uniref:hypothetical protein n=1 Tax=Actinoplanes sp. NPDC051513 TaxID=3363908 RepID=UPI00378A6DD0